MSEKWLDWIDKHLLACLASIFLLRSAFLGFNGLGLVGDESYYWDWSRHPDWCYYSKPPMVAWLIGAFTWLLGDSIFALRLPAVLLGTGFLWFFHATAKAFYGSRAAAFALLLILATPDNVLANLIMTIDPPLYCFWMMSLYFLRQALFDHRSAAWLWAGVAAGLGLLSKQVAVALPLMLLVYILLDRKRYGLLKREFWIYLAPILLAGIPILLWNQQHDWIMFSHSKSHFANQVVSSFAGSFKNVAELFIYQLLLISPVVFVLVLVVSCQGVLRYRSLPAERQFLVLMGPVLLLGVLLMSFGQKVQGNWPMPFYFTAIMLLIGEWRQGRWHKLLAYGVKAGYVLVAVTYLLPFLLQVFHLQNTVLDPIKRFKYWHVLAESVQSRRQQALPDLANSFVLALGHRNLASELAFYLPDHPKVFRYEAGGAIGSQYELWPGPQEFLGRNAIVVSDAPQAPEQIKAAFQRFSFMGQIPNPKTPKAPYYLYLGEGLQQWPTADRPANIVEHE